MAGAGKMATEMQYNWEGGLLEKNEPTGRIGSNQR